jgi:hypothetical protein
MLVGGGLLTGHSNSRWPTSAKMKSIYEVKKIHILTTNSTTKKYLTLFFRFLFGLPDVPQIKNNIYREAHVTTCE